MPAIIDKATFDPALNMARQALYRFAALTLLDPKIDSWNELDGLRDDRLLLEAAALVRSMPEAVPEQLALGERPLADLDPSLVLDRLPASRQQLNQEYEDTFGLLVSNACPPYETEYINSKFTFQRSNTLADISGFYRAFGLTTGSVLPERPDHIVQELEFVAFLIGMERQAAASDAPNCQQRIELCHDAQARFVRDHLAWWTGAFARLLTRENPRGFFAASGAFLSALIPAERAILGVPVPSQAVAPSTMEPPEACEGCPLPVL